MWNKIQWHWNCLTISGFFQLFCIVYRSPIQEPLSPNYFENAVHTQIIRRARVCVPHTVRIWKQRERERDYDIHSYFVCRLRWYLIAALAILVKQEDGLLVNNRGQLQIVGGPGKARHSSSTRLSDVWYNISNHQVTIPALSNLWDIEHFCSKKNWPFTKWIYINT